MNIVDAGFIVLSIGGNPIGCGQTVGGRVQRSLTQTTCKGTSKYHTNRLGFVSGSVNFSGLIALGTGDFQGLVTQIKADRTTAEIDFVVAYNDGTDTENILWGKALLTEVSFDAGEPDNNATYSGTLQIQGEPNPDSP